MSPTQAPPPWPALVAAFETLTPESLPDLLALYAADARFKDPFNDVVGPQAIERIFRHMFVQVAASRFEVVELLAQGHQAFATWNFHFGLNRRPSRSLCIHGATHWVLGAHGRVALHRDYWDAAEELYEQLPVLGGFMRWLKRRARR